jgi:hypothetical protein
MQVGEGVSGFALDVCRLMDFIPVDLEFAHTKKPGLNDDISVFHRYASFWKRDGKRAVQIAQVPVNAAELAINRPDLQQIENLDGSSNKVVLDGMAQRLAEAVFSVPPTIDGATLTLCRPVPVACTGQVLSVHWRTDEERPHTIATLGTLPPLAPAAELQTRAFGAPVNRNKALESVIAPKGIRP